MSKNYDGVGGSSVSRRWNVEAEIGTSVPCLGAVHIAVLTPGFVL